MPIDRRNLMVRTGATLGSVLLGKATPALAASSPFPGTYLGALEIGAVRLRLKLIIAPDLSATLFSLDQGNAAIPANDVKTEFDRILLTFQIIGATYEARLVSKDRLEGTFTQAGRPLPLRLTRGDKVEAVIDQPLPPLDAAGLRALRVKSGAPAIGAAWNRAGRQTTVLVDGLRSAAATVPVTNADKWHIGSMTKSMTATLVARLVEAGFVSWDQSVDQILGQVLPGHANGYAGVTLLHLLSHRAGLAPNIPQEAMAAFSRKELKDARAERLRYAAIALSQAPTARAGERMIYSNNGYIIVGAMLEQVMGKPWEKLIKDHVFMPLALTSAGFGPPGKSGSTDHPSGHSIGPNGARTPLFLDNPTALGPAGRVHLSLADMITYLSAHRDRPEAFLKSKAWKTLHSPHFGGEYALGWVVGADGSLWHNGSNSVWYAEGVVDRAKGIVAALVSNDPSLTSTVRGSGLSAAMLTASMEG